MLRIQPLRSVRLHGSWLIGLGRRRTGRLVITAIGVALAVGLLASLGAFLSASKATMTNRAIDAVAVDWQIEATAGVVPAVFTREVARRRASSPPRSSRSRRAVVSSPPELGRHRRPDPGKCWVSAGRIGRRSPRSFAISSAPALACCCSNKRRPTFLPNPATRSPSDAAGLPPIAVTIDGVVDIPQSDSLFQAVGAPIGARATSATRQRADCA